MAVKAPYTSISCSFLGIDCPSYIPMHGFVDDEYKEVYNMFLNKFKRGEDMGASISAYVDGRQVLSLQGGWKDQKNKIEYTNETLQMVFSCTKTLASFFVQIEYFIIYLYLTFYYYYFRALLLSHN